MFGDGKKQELIITVLPRTSVGMSMFGASETTYEYDRICVWVEKGYLAKFKKIKGVFNVIEDSPEPRYFIYVDPRFDTQWVVREIEGVVKTSKPSKSKGTDFENSQFGRWVTISYDSKKKGKK